MCFKINLHKDLILSTLLYIGKSRTGTADTSVQKQMLQAHVRDFMGGPQDKWIHSRSNKSKGRPTRKTDRGSEKKKASLV